MQCSIYETEKAQILLNAGANIEAQDKNGKTALTLALRSKPEMVVLLIENGAKVDSNIYDNTASNGSTNPKKLISALLDAGVPVPESPDKPLQRATRRANTYFIETACKRLVRAGLDETSANQIIQDKTSENAQDNHYRELRDFIRSKENPSRKTTINFNNVESNTQRVSPNTQKRVRRSTIASQTDDKKVTSKKTQTNTNTESVASQTDDTPNEPEETKSKSFVTVASQTNDTPHESEETKSRSFVSRVSRLLPGCCRKRPVSYTEKVLNRSNQPEQRETINM